MLLAIAVFSSLLLDVGAVYLNCSAPDAEVRIYQQFFGKFGNDLYYDRHIGEGARKELWDHITDKGPDIEKIKAGGSVPQTKFEDKMRSALEGFQKSSAQISALPKGAPYGCSCKYDVGWNSMDILCFFRKTV